MHWLLLQDVPTTMASLVISRAHVCMCMQVLFNYGPNYISTYCSAVGTAYLAQSTTAPSFNAPSNNPPQPVSPPFLYPSWLQALTD